MHLQNSRIQGRKVWNGQVEETGHEIMFTEINIEEKHRASGVRGGEFR
jgi:hypothetical protein